MHPGFNSIRCGRSASCVLPLLFSLAGICAAGCSQEIAATPAESAATKVNLQQVDSSLPISRPLASASKIPVAHVAPRFIEVARERGIDFTFFTDAVPDRYFLPEIMGGGAGWLDFDGDGRLDLYVREGCRLEAPDETPPDRVSRLFRNMGHGEFHDVTSASDSGFQGYGQGCAVGDFDADGFPDLFIANFGTNALFQNNGDGTFADVTTVSGVGAGQWASSAAWFDADADGLLDLYVANYMDVTFENSKVCEYDKKPGYCGPGSYKPLPDVVYRNRGDGTFVDATEEWGFSETEGNGLAVVAADFDNDLRPEVYVANDMTPNHLFTQSSTFDAEGVPRKRYANVAHSAGCALSDAGMNEAGMGIACADFDGDGLPDLFLTHYYHMKNTLYHNRGGLIFDDDSRRTRIAATSFESLGFGTWAFDYDRDGDPDLFVANGHVLGSNHTPNEMRPQLLLNTRGVFSDISDEAGEYFQGFWLGRGVAAADFDDDGDLDLVVTHLDRRLALLSNETTTGNGFIGLELLTVSRIPPVGGRVVVTCGSLRQVMTIMAGGSYLCASDSRILAGIGDASDPVQVELYWPSGRVDTFNDLEPNRYWRIVEGRQPRPLPLPEGTSETPAIAGNPTAKSP
jgi:hypothetical protein